MSARTPFTLASRSRPALVIPVKVTVTMTRAATVARPVRAESASQGFAYAPGPKLDAAAYSHLP